MPSLSQQKIASEGKSSSSSEALKATKAGLGFFSVEPVTIDAVSDEKAEKARWNRSVRLIMTQAVVIGALGAALIFSVPLFQPIYSYQAITPDRKAQSLLALSMPNLTNQAVLSWATNTITELMTFGFGNYQSHLKIQRPRFTTEGWTGFSKAFDTLGIGQAFLERRLVLTTVPANTAVITKQGETKEGLYEWTIQMPIIMTYATNNNVTRKERSVIELTLTRIPVSQNPSGLGIKTWNVLR
ncbi:MAG: DotI/IcmL/TraM family protein [Alphaproteobacteria bacterium]|nr:DotI/IcmL/TraM family protein [Alphaproteobacteria bacterium]